MKKIVTFGEIMLRLATAEHSILGEVSHLQATYGGGEANVAVALCNYGLDGRFITKLPDNDLGQAAINDLRRYGVNTKGIVRGGERIGIYYLERGASQKPSKVVYDRAYSSMYDIKPEDFDWDAIFEGVDCFHFSGITPALGSHLVDICMEACKAAKRHGVLVSCDINYRGKMWTREAAGKVMRTYAPYVDLYIASVGDIADMFDVHVDDQYKVDGKLTKEGYEDVFGRFAKQYDVKYVATTFRGSISASDNTYSGMFYDGKACYTSKVYPMHLVDRVGGGDGFTGGLIYGLMQDESPQDVVEFAAAASCLKHSIEGDYNRVTVEEVKYLVNGPGRGRVEW